MEYQQSANYQQQASGNLPSSNHTNEKMLLWSQPTQYMVDSGYSTQAPSISSIDAFLNDEQMEAVPNVVQQQQPPPPPPQVDWNYQNNKMAQPMDNDLQMMQQQQQNELSDNALENWMNYQDNSEMALKAIPDLIKLLNDEDHVVVSQAAMLVHQMSRKKTSCLALIESQDAVSSLVFCLTNDNANIEMAKNVVGTFYNISMHKQGIQSIIQSNAIQPLINLLTVPMETVVSYAITTLHNVLLAFNEIKTQVRKFGGIQKMVPLLSKHTNAKFLAIVVDCLQIISYSHQESKLAILEYGGPELLVEILRTNTYPKLILMITRLLKVLSICTQNKKALINLGAMQALTLHLNSGSSNEIQNCLITLRNLSDAATRINGLEKLIESLIRLISSADDVVSTLAAGILSNLTCNNEMNKLATLHNNGIAILLRVIETSTIKTQLIEPCICTLRHITNRHQEALRAQDEIRLNNGLAIIANLLVIQPRKWPIIKATLGLIRNLAQHNANVQLFKGEALVEKLMHILYDSFTQAQQTLTIEDVNLLDIVDVSGNIILQLAKDYQNQIIMKEFNCIPFFIQLFYSPIQKVQYLAACLLIELVKNKECVECIDQQPGLHMCLNKYMNNFSQDSVLANYSHSIMQHIQEYKTNKFRPPQMNNPYQPPQANWIQSPQQQHQPTPPPPQMHQQQQPQMVNNQLNNNGDFYAQQQQMNYQSFPQQQHQQMSYDNFTPL